MLRADSSGPQETGCEKMAAFALIIDLDRERRNIHDSSPFFERVADYKCLNKDISYLEGGKVSAAKLDSPASAHRGVISDEQTGSWVMAAGSPVYKNFPPDIGLSRLLEDFIRKGDSVLSECDGVFALVLFDGRTETVSVATDPFGYFSVFYAVHNQVVYAATSALAVAETAMSEPDDLGVSCFLHTGKVFGGLTLWDGVKRMQAARIYRFSEKGVEASVYWDLRIDERVTELSLSDSIGSSLELLDRIFKRNLAGEKKVWADLTGGFDTRFMTMLLDRSGIPFKADCVGPPGFPDVKIAWKIAEKMGWEFEHFDLPSNWFQDGGRYFKEALGRGDAHINIFLLAKTLWVYRKAQEQHRALVNGFGGELWRGPIWWPERNNLGQSPSVHYDRQLWSLMHPVDDRVFLRRSDDLVSEEIVQQLREVGERNPDWLNSAKLDRIWTYRETGHVGAWVSAASGILRSIPILFSKDIVNHVVSLNPEWKKKKRMMRLMLAALSPALAGIEVEGGRSAEPPGFGHPVRWMQSQVRFTKKALNKLSEIFVGRSLRPPDAPLKHLAATMNKGIERYVEEEKLLDPSYMRSGYLYKAEHLHSLFLQAGSKGFSQFEFLGRILTVEMAQRAVGSGDS